MMMTLFQAASKGNLEAVKDILRNASDQSTDITEKKNAALLAAAMYGQDRIADVLVRNGAECNYCSNSDQHTALHWASYRGHPSVVEILLASNADVDQQDKDGNTALMFASSKGFQHIVRILLEYKADTRIRNKLNETAIHVACLGCDSAVIVKFLVKFGSYVNQPGRHGWTPLHYCAEYERVQSCRVLLEARADPTLVDSIKDTPLDIVEDKETCGEEIRSLLSEATHSWNARAEEESKSNTPTPRKVTPAANSPAAPSPTATVAPEIETGSIEEDEKEGILHESQNDHNDDDDGDDDEHESTLDKPTI